MKFIGLHSNLPDEVKWGLMEQLLRVQKNRRRITEHSQYVIRDAVWAVNLAAHEGVRAGKEAEFAQLITQMVVEIKELIDAHIARK